MEQNTEKFIDIFKKIYECERIHIEYNISFDDIMKSNETRLDYLNLLLEEVKNNECSDELKKLLQENIEYINSFINGKFNKEISVPKKYFDDKDECSIVPSDEELDYLFLLIQQNVEIFNEMYNERDLVITLPENSFNMNMTRILEIKQKNLAHLMGLTESELKNNPNSNLLKRYFLENVENKEKYGKIVSEQLLNWILSEEGKNEIKKLNQIVLDFIEVDRKKHPNAYEGKKKIKNLKKFKKRFKDATGYDYPIIKYSRYITKCINNINYMNLSNINQMVLDYNAPINPETKEPIENDEKDIFIINTPLELLLENSQEYLDLIEGIKKIIKYYALHPDEDTSSIEAFFREEGIDTSDKYIQTYINLIQSYDFVGKQGINPDQSVALNQIDAVISKYFASDIHLIGFGTNFDLEESGEIKTTDLTETTVNYSHCDTSISIKITDLIGKYYKRGRAFFIDKVYDTNGGIVRISTPIEELQFLELSGMLGNDKTLDLEKLENKMKKFNQKYQVFKNNLEKYLEHNKRR